MPASHRKATHVANQEVKIEARLENPCLCDFALLAGQGGFLSFSGLWAQMFRSPII